MLRGFGIQWKGVGGEVLSMSCKIAGFTLERYRMIVTGVCCLLHAMLLLVSTI